MVSLVFLVQLQWLHPYPFSGTGLGAYFTSISPILAIDPLIDMGRTCLNVSGSLTNALVVDKIMGTIDKDAYNNPNEGRV